MEALGLVKVDRETVVKAGENFLWCLEKASDAFDEITRNYTRDFSWCERIFGIAKLVGEDLYYHDVEDSWFNQYEFAKHYCGLSEDFANILYEFSYKDSCCMATKNIVKSGQKEIYLNQKLLGCVNKWSGRGQREILPGWKVEIPYYSSLENTLTKED